MDNERISVLEDIRCQIFGGQFEKALQGTIALLEQLLSDSTVGATAVNPVAEAIMAAVEQKDYLLFADLVYFEIPALGQTGQGDMA